jgi:multidrug efflux pump subunit AcrB
MNISTPFIQRPIATSLLMLGILLVGLAAYPLLPVAPLPQVDFPTIQVTTQFPGASPETMASSVAQPLETQFAQIPGLTQMTSTSALGNTVISLQFDLNRNIDAAAGDVQAAINAAGGQLPKTLPTPPTYRKVNPANSPILVLAVHSDTLPLTKVDDYAETIIAQQISQISGVAYVAIGGQQKPAVRVEVDPAKLASLGLSLEDVRSVILNATTDAPKGNLDGAARDFAIYDNDQIMNAAPWNDIIIAYHNGAPVRVRDVGRAVDGPQNTRLAAWDGETPSIILIIFKQPGANVIDTVDSIKAHLPQMTRAIPPVVKVDIASDRTTTIRASVADVEFTMMLTIGLVVAVIFLFLRSLWATVIPGVTVPLALVGTFGLMYVFNYSLDNLSLMGLTIAVGFVVVDAIVMLENIHRHIEDGLPPLEAAIKGAGEIGFTIVSISLSLIAVFIPLLLMGGLIGRLFREFAVVVSMTIVVSAIVSLTLTPMMCSRFLNHDGGGEHGWFYRVTERGFDAMLAGYARGLDFVLRHQRLTLAVFVATVVATGYLFVIIPKGFFPQQDTGLITGFTEAAQDVSFPEMVRRQHALVDVIRRDPDVFSVVSSLAPRPGRKRKTMAVSSSR